VYYVQVISWKLKIVNWGGEGGRTVVILLVEVSYIQVYTLSNLLYTIICQ
jgi:hypothetical protein